MIELEQAVSAAPLTREKVDALFVQAQKLQDKYQQQIALLDQLKRALVIQLVHDEGVEVHERGHAPRRVQGEHVTQYDLRLVLHTFGLTGG